MAFDFNVVSPDYFRTLGTPLVSGREFTPQDSADAPQVIVVNEAMARRYWPGQDAVGKRTSRGEVVGVVRNSKEKGLTADPRPTIYLPLLQSYVPELTLHVRTAADPEALVAALRREVQSLDATLPLYNVDAGRTEGRLALHRARGGGAVDAVRLLALLSPPSDSMACCRTVWPSAPARWASAWRKARSRATCSPSSSVRACG